MLSPIWHIAESIPERGRRDALVLDRRSERRPIGGGPLSAHPGVAHHPGARYRTAGHRRTRSSGRGVRGLVLEPSWSLVDPRCVGPTDCQQEFSYWCRCRCDAWPSSTTGTGIDVVQPQRPTRHPRRRDLATVLGPPVRHRFLQSRLVESRTVRCSMVTRHCARGGHIARCGGYRGGNSRRMGGRHSGRSGHANS